VHHECAADHRPRLHRLDRELCGDPAGQHTAEREGQRRREHESFREQIPTQEGRRVRAGEDDDADESEQDAGDPGGREALAGEEHARERGRQDRREADDDRRRRASRPLLADEQEGVVRGDQEDRTDPDERPLLPPPGSPAVGRIDRVAEHQEAGDVVPECREQDRRKVREARLDRHERSPPQPGEGEKREQVAVAHHSVSARRRPERYALGSSAVRSSRSPRSDSVAWARSSGDSSGALSQ